MNLSESTPVNATVRSLLVPGWGQIFNGQAMKGAAFFFATGSLATGAYSADRSADKTYKDYKAKSVADDPLYDDYKVQRNRATALKAAAAGLWVYSIIDAFFVARGGAPFLRAHHPARPTVWVRPDRAGLAWRFSGKGRS
ncbi:MAG: hypothetical protein HY548_09180 [Elusimicrobia bacterium]|nr:hypothetical protein [Elusimicrobiota bacterium]